MEGLSNNIHKSNKKTKKSVNIKWGNDQDYASKTILNLRFLQRFYCIQGYV